MSVEPCLADETLVAVLDATATAEVRAEVERHTSRCTACRELLSTLAKQTTPGATEPAAPPAHDPVPERIGRYVITGELGAGGMGVVYSARDPELDRTVALKLLRAGAASAALQPRLRREAQALAQLVHANVVTVYDAGTHDDRIFVAMEHVDGETLARWERAHAPREVLETYIAAGRGLAAAHAAGIIHRDFKPDNVLIGRDGRVRVADFGLARAAGTPLPSMPERTEPVSPIAPTTPATSALTEHGALVGTPYYIAPELYSGGEADARSDQYSFCVALSTALSRGRARPAASRRVRSALARGLSERPEQRFASMDALLARLAPPRRRRVAAAALAAAALAAATAGALALRPSTDAPCARAGDGMAAVWSPLQRANLDGALARTRLPYAAATARELARVLDRYAADWREMRVGACEATRVRGEQSAELLDLRMQCLDERRRAVGQLVEVLASGDTVALPHAVAAAHSLPAIADCADVRALAGPVRPPNPQVRERVAALGDELAASATLRATGHYVQALADAQRVLAEARALGYRPLEARAALEVGRSLDVTDRNAEARAAEQSALLAAEAGRDDRTRALALIELTLLVGHDLAEREQAAALREQAAAALERLDHPPQLEVALLEISGQLAEDAGLLDDAERAQRAVIERSERMYGRDDLLLVDPLRRLAHVHLLRMQAAEARPLLERVQAIEERVLGADHPDLAVTLAMLAEAFHGLHEYDRAATLYQRAIAVIERALGPESLMLAAMLSDLGGNYEWQGAPEAAVPLHRRAVAIATKHLGPLHVRTLRFRASLASALEDLDRHAEALAEILPVLAEQHARLGDHQDTELTLALTAHVELGAGRYAAARDHAREAVAMTARVYGPAYPPVEELIALGRAHLGLGEAARAVDVLTRARALPQDEQDPLVVAWLDALLGRALVDSGRDRARGLALARAARARLATDERAADEVHQIDVWAADHRLSIR